MDERQRTLQLIRANAVNHAYFFDALDDPGWLPFLAEAGFFREPPPPEEGEDWVRFPAWPESAYLARIAAGDPERVAEVAAGIPPTENVRVVTDLATIATALPTRAAARFADRIREWVAGHRILLALPEEAARLISRLADSGDLDTALALAAELLRIEGEERAGVVAPRTEPVARIDHWQFGQALNEITPALLAADRDRALSFLADLLARAVNLEAGEEGGDYTYIARPSIGDHEQNHDHGLLDLLVSAMRDASIEAASTVEGRTAVLAELGAREPAVFARIAFHVIAERGDPEEIFTSLSDPEAEASVPLWHEYSELLTRRFGELDADQQEVVLELLASSEERILGDETEQEAEKRRRWHLLRRLAMVAPELHGHWAARYEDLRDQLGEPEHPDFLSYVSIFTGPSSPLGIEQLRELGAEGTVDALGKWEAPGGFEDPTPEGLSRVLEEAIKTDPRPYAEIATRFQALEPTYVRGLLGGLAAALKEERDFPWPAVLRLSAWVLAQPPEEQVENAGLDRDPGWSWTRKAIADLLSDGLAQRAVEIPIANREPVFSLLAALAEDPNPSRDHEAQYGGSNMDPATLAMNTVRGEALNALVRYCLWVARHSAAEGIGLDAIPEAREILERHLDPEVDPSLAVRSVYGRWFAQLFNLDRAWIAAQIPSVFPADPESARLFAAAFDSFLAFTRAWPPAFDLLNPAYRLAAERADQIPHSQTFQGDPREQLGDHLMALRAYGTIDLDPGGLFDIFWSRAPAEIRGHVVRTAGWTLERTENPDPQVFPRLAETWEWIAERESGEEAAAVLPNFAAWLTVPALDPTWLLEQALAVLARRIELDPESVAFKALPRLARTDTRSALAVLRGMLETSQKGWAPFGSREEIRELLELCLASPSSDTREEARLAVDQLIGLGLRDFRDLAELGEAHS